MHVTVNRCSWPVMMPYLLRVVIVDSGSGNLFILRPCNFNFLNLKVLTNTPFCLRTQVLMDFGHKYHMLMYVSIDVACRFNEYFSDFHDGNSCDIGFPLNLRGFDAFKSGVSIIRLWACDPSS